MRVCVRTCVSMEGAFGYVSELVSVYIYVRDGVEGLCSKMNFTYLFIFLILKI